MWESGEGEPEGEAAAAAVVEEVVEVESEVVHDTSAEVSADATFLRAVTPPANFSVTFRQLGVPMMR